MKVDANAINSTRNCYSLIVVIRPKFGFSLQLYSDVVIKCY